MKLVWLDLNASHAHSSLALPLLHTACSHLRGIQWEAVRGTVHADIPAVTAEVSAHAPDCVAATLYLFNRRIVLDVLARVKALHPGCTVLVGGPECLGSMAPLLHECPAIDIAVRGEGDAALPAILERLTAGEALTDIAGIAWRDASGRVVEDDHRWTASDWASAPPPCTSPLFDSDKPFVQLETSRGCARRCAFCTSAGQTPVRTRPLPMVVRELTLLHAKGIREIRVLDRTFNLDPERAAQLLDIFLHRFRDMTFHLELHPEMLPDTLRERLSQATLGNLHVEAGLQTTEADVAADIRRGGVPRKALEGIAFLTSCSAFDTHVDLLAGLPGQTFESVLADVSRLVRIGPAEIQLEIVKALPGTDFREHAHDRGVVISPISPYDVLRTACMDVEAMRQTALLSRLLDLTYNHAALKASFRQLVPDTAMLRQLLGDLTRQGRLDQPLSLKNRFKMLYEWAQKERPDARDILRLAWIQAGLSPSADIPRATPWKDPLPPDLTWDKGGADNAAARHARTWRLDTADGPYYIIYDRARSQHAPVAIARRRPERVESRF